jgi:hypothetical protein
MSDGTQISYDGDSSLRWEPWNPGYFFVFYFYFFWRTKKISVHGVHENLLKKVLENVHEKNVVSFVWLVVGATVGWTFGVLETYKTKQKILFLVLEGGKEDKIVKKPKEQKNKTPVLETDFFCSGSYFFLPKYA